MRTRTRKRAKPESPWAMTNEIKAAWKRLQKDLPDAYPPAMSFRQRRLPV